MSYATALSMGAEVMWDQQDQASSAETAVLTCQELGFVLLRQVHVGDELAAAQAETEALMNTVKPDAEKFNAYGERRVYALQNDWEEKYPGIIGLVFKPIAALTKAADSLNASRLDVGEPVQVHKGFVTSLAPESRLEKVTYNDEGVLAVTGLKGTVHAELGRSLGKGPAAFDIEPGDELILPMKVRRTDSRFTRRSTQFINPGQYETGQDVRAAYLTLVYK